MKVRAKIPVMRPNTPRRLVPDKQHEGQFRDEAVLLPEDGAVDVDDDRYWRRRIAIGDVELVAEGGVIVQQDALAPPAPTKSKGKE
jgi:hypothetical protein